MEGEGFARKVTLNDGNKMPMFGLGVFAASGEETLRAAKFALKSGYRLIDTAAYYENEAEVGQAIKESGIKREDIFLVTKLRTEGHGYDECLQDFNTSLTKLDVSYVDLFLIHTPRGGKNVDSFKAMMKLKEQGLIRSIGVSNFGVNHLKEMEKAGLPTPAVNQIELNAYWRLEDIVKYCQEKGIAVMGYAPIFRGQKNDDPILVEMASRYKKTVPQLLIRWSFQKGYITIPKSSKPERILENADIFNFTISDEDMKALNAMPTEQCYTPLVNITDCPWKG
ncbi:hypothetical protein OS493_010051 [Desmophyllum pertusum]|uniref:NADP-dependent oxidoreductase domain-containing protein n=1 Tax=Desmophyllum pertusum TaxID=174260 RepID=A0A9W9YEC4_9CNID|nr:hypothetical protein OS493_010051 [Desmophyllum pertusum]